MRPTRRIGDDERRAEHAAEVLRAVAHPLRLRIVATLCRGEEHANALAARLALPPPAAYPAPPLPPGTPRPRAPAATGLLYDPARLKKPLVRRSQRGEDVFEEVSWDAALNEGAARLEDVERRHG